MAIHGDKVPAEPPFEVAIIGAGIVGTALAVGLLNRGVQGVTVYEALPAPRDIGAGLVFVEASMEAMRLLDPHIVDALQRTGIDLGRLLRGDVRGKLGADNPDTLFELDHISDAVAVHRGHFQSALLELLPAGTIRFNMHLEGLRQAPGERVRLIFADGTEVETDAMIGCDGIKSRVRELVLPPGDPAAQPSYSHHSTYRCLVPMVEAEKLLGKASAHQTLRTFGPNATVLRFPIAKGTLINVAFTPYDPNPWPTDIKPGSKSTKLTTTAPRQELLDAFASWGDTARKLIEMFPIEVQRWGYFDLGDHPLDSYTYGRVCLAGDAAHASTPNLAIGAGTGIEDALVLATLLKAAQTSLAAAATFMKKDTDKKTQLLTQVFEIFDGICRTRSQEIVQSARVIGEVQSLRYASTGSDKQKIQEELRLRFEKAWLHDQAEMVAGAMREFEKAVSYREGEANGMH
jgi:salicylate hydroxylase